MNTPRVEYALNSDIYRAAPGLSHSDAKRLRRTPWHFKALTEPRDASLIKAPSPQMSAGIMIHTATLEPHLFDERYVVGPEVSKNSNAWRQFAADCAQSGQEPISQLQRDIAFAIAASACAVPDFAMIMDHADMEVSLWWNCATTGVLCKCRPDVMKLYPPGIPVLDDPEHPIPPERLALMRERGFAILGDLKTTEDAGPESFSRSVADFSYHTQAQWYCEGVEAALGIPVLSFLFCVVEREYPHAAATYTLDDMAFTVGTDINKAARETYAACKRADSWPGYPQETRDIALPPWYMKRYLQGLPA